MANIFTVKLERIETLMVNVIADSAEDAEDIVESAVYDGLTVSDFFENEVVTESISASAMSKTRGYGVQMLPDEFYPEEDEGAGA